MISFTAVVDCDTLPDPENGTVSNPFTTFGSVATYSCVEGFSLDGPAERTCTSMEQWSGEAPLCTSES